MKEIERHVSADGLLTLVALIDEAGDTTCGFEGSPWHTHGDLLDIYGVDKGDLSTFIRSVISGRQVIGVLMKNGAITQAWVVDIYGQDEEDTYRQPDEVLQLRLWDGTIIEEFRS